MTATVMVALLVSAGAGGGQARTSVEDTNSSARVRDLAIGYDHACILLTDGTVRCWGHRDEGQLGDGDTSGSVALVEVRDLTGVAALAAGGDHTCALLDLHPARCRHRSAIELASDVEGLRLVLLTAVGDRYRVRVSDDGSVVGLWRR